jgi:hypothetical protein
MNEKEWVEEIATMLRPELLKFRKVSLQTEVIDDENSSHRGGAESAEEARRFSALALRSLRLRR